MRRRTTAAAVVIAAALVVAVPSVAWGQEEPSDESSTTTTEATTTTTEATTTTTVPPEGEPECEPSYPDLCIPPGLPDINCDDIPFTDFPVLPPDPHGFDRDKDGIGCESGGEIPPPAPPAAPAEPVTEEPDFTG